jgi:cell division protein FtsB
VADVTPDDALLDAIERMRIAAPTLTYEQDRDDLNTLLALVDSLRADNERLWAQVDRDQHDAMQARARLDAVLAELDGFYRQADPSADRLIDRIRRAATGEGT